MIANEVENVIKLYDLKGGFLEVITTRFDENDPERITLHREGDGSGYWVFTEREEGR
ncbi:hypothetical protein [Natronosalvus vescus]|uniref:hypothetical protein n=1 Tax=Natronosalvus vescus TaxID=2953881 RepID=UPI0020903F74|nr:hypothetical protein [Natronosalvus vescus]